MCQLHGRQNTVSVLRSNRPNALSWQRQGSGSVDVDPGFVYRRNAEPWTTIGCQHLDGSSPVPRPLEPIELLPAPFQLVGHQHSYRHVWAVLVEAKGRVTGEAPPRAVVSVSANPTVYPTPIDIGEYVMVRFAWGQGAVDGECCGRFEAIDAVANGSVAHRSTLTVVISRRAPIEDSRQETRRPGSKLDTTVVGWTMPGAIIGERLLA